MHINETLWENAIYNEHSVSCLSLWPVLADTDLHTHTFTTYTSSSTENCTNKKVHLQKCIYKTCTLIKRFFPIYYF